MPLVRVQILAVFRARLLCHQRHILLEGDDLSVQPFDGDRLDLPAWLPDVETLLGSIDPAGTSLAGELAAHIVVLMVDGQVTADADRARKGSFVHRKEPAIRIDHLGNRRQPRKLWAGHPRWLIATGTCLVEPFVIVMGEVGLGDLNDLGERSWPMHEALTRDQASDENARHKRSNRAGAAG